MQLNYSVRYIKYIFAKYILLDKNFYFYNYYSLIHDSQVLFLIMG